ncbi:hypothetical protein BKA62DRAFT_699694 [Auriculariales sp. MPI-PUGE-AT-0066]|nr:hypothetical protein BKA62DRAFT_699694 [Auriculariales sp. MPI-PUGE-AT-0066]
MPPMQLIGRVSKAGKMVKTVTVTVERLVTQFPTLKRIKRSNNFLVHDEADALRVDDVVLIRNCPPISKQKKFTLERVLKSPESQLEARRAAEALQAELEGGVAPPSTLFARQQTRKTSSLRFTEAQLAAMSFKQRRLLEAQGKVKLPDHLTTYPKPGQWEISEDPSEAQTEPESVDLTSDDTLQVQTEPVSQLDPSTVQL